MASNSGKRLDRLEKLADAIATRDKQHHFVVVDADGDEQLQIDTLAKANIIKPNDDIQVVNIPWRIRELRGAQYIPEGSTDDPLADPRTRAGANTGRGTGIGGDGGEPMSSQGLDLLPSFDQERRWKDHERRIELDGTRYKGPIS